MMSTKELYELASLDALGFLDDEERRDFEREYAKATPEIQSQIRREQLRHAVQVDLLPEIEPPAGLKSRVLEAVCSAITGVSHEPVGQIGRQDSFRIVNNQAPFWRAACIAFATASMVLALFVVRVNEKSNEISGMLSDSQLNQQIMDELSPQFVNVLFAENMSRVPFSPIATDADSVIPEAHMFIERDNGSGYVMLRNLPELHSEYTLECRDAYGNIVAKTSFINMGGLIPVPFKSGEGASPVSCRVISPRGVGGESRVILTTDEL